MPAPLRCNVYAYDPKTDETVRKQKRDLSLHSEREWLLRFVSWALLHGYSVEIELREPAKNNPPLTLPKAQ